MRPVINTALESAAGSGKTRELTKQFLRLYLDDAQYPLDTMYGITFTNEATREMKKRILRYLDLLQRTEPVEGPDQEIVDYFRKLFPDLARRADERRRHLIRNLSDLNVSTFHSLFASFLSSIPFAAGIVPGYRIIDEAETQRIFDGVLIRFFDEFSTDHRLVAALRELADAEETSLKTVITETYWRLQPYLPYLVDLLGRETAVRAAVEGTRQGLTACLDEFRRYVTGHEAAARTTAGSMDKRFAAFLDAFDEFFSSGRVENLPPSLLDGSYAGIQYVQKFLHHLGAGSSDFITLLGRLDDCVRSFLNALSDEQLIIHLKPIIEVNRRWIAAKQDQNVLTFDDIETRTLQALQGSADIAYLYFKIGAHIRHLLIDEFQDTSLRQLAILDPIIEEITAVSPPEKSIFYVGDPHQAIFRWRGGAAELFDYLLARYPGKIQKQRLPCNRRSAAAIVDFVNRVTQSRDQADLAAAPGWVQVQDLGLVPAVEDGKVRIWERTLDLIRELHDHQGYEYRDIAVLTRRNQSAREVADFIGRHGIPVLSRSSADLLGNPDVQFLVQMMRFLDNPEDDFSLSHILLDPVHEGGESMLVDLRRSLPHKTLYLALCDRYPDRPVTQVLGRLLKLVYFLDPYGIVSRIIAECKLPVTYGLAALLDAASSFVREGSLPLSAFLEWLEQSGTAIEIPSVCLDGVSVLTVHKAKGLEFDVVILPETFYQPRGGENRRLIMSYQPGDIEPERVYWRAYGKYDPVLAEAEAQRVGRDEMNLLYVALTRARLGLYVLGFRTGKEPGKPTGFWFSQVIERSAPDHQAGQVVRKGEPRPTAVIEPYQTPPTVTPVVHEERTLYSPTERRIEIIEPRRRRSMEFGEIVHKALSRIGWLDQADADKTAIEAAAYAAARYGRLPGEAARIEERVRPLLDKTLHDPDLRAFFYSSGADRLVRNELAMYYEDGRRDVSIHIDRLIIEPDRIVIVDYKTGTDAGDYDQQLRAYAKGAALIFPRRAIETFLLYLEHESGKKIVRID